MKKQKIWNSMLTKYIFLVAFLILILLNYRIIFGWLDDFLVIVSPLIFGFIMAYIVNIPMNFFERHYFPDSNHGLVEKTRRPVSIFLSLIVILAVTIFVVYLVLPQVVSVVVEVFEILPLVADGIQSWILNQEELYPIASQFMGILNIDWQNILQNTLDFLNSFIQAILETVLSTLGSTISFLFNLLLSIMIMLYLLLSKERLIRHFKALVQAYTEARTYRRILYVLEVAHEIFYNFISGEVVEAMILGTMVTVGMYIFGFPYASMVGALTGLTAVIPIVGAYLSGAVGVLLIMMHSPVQALLFIVFIVVVQQIESNLIYPRVVGSSIGLPGLWVLVAVTIGGGLWGISGMLLSVPVVSALYKLLKNDVKYRNANK